MGGTVTVWALHLPEGMARDVWGFVGIGGPYTSQKATTPEFPVASATAAAAAAAAPVLLRFQCFTTSASLRMMSVALLTPTKSSRIKQC